MAIGVRGSSAWNVSTTQNKIFASPNGVAQAGDLIILFSAWRPYTVTSTAINEGYTELIDETPGSTANGVGAGSSRLWVGYKESAGGTELSPTITRSGAITPEATSWIVLSKAADETWDIAQLAASVEQAMGSTAMSHDLTTVDAIESGDWIFALTAVADDSATFTRGTTAISGGPSWAGNVVEPYAHASSTTGNDMAADVVYREASSAVASGQTITVTATLSAAERVATVLLRVRVTTTTQTVEVGLVDAAGAVYAPTVAPGAVTAELGLVDGSAAVYDLSVAAAGGAQSIGPLGLLDAASTVYTPTLAPGPVSLSLGLVDGAGTVYAPTVIPGARTTSLPLLDAGAAVYALALAAGPVGITVPLVDAAGTVYAPTLTAAALTALLPLLDAGGAVYAPTLVPGPRTLGALPLVDAGGAVYAPALASVSAITIGLVDAGAAVYAPSLVPGARTLVLPLVDAGAGVYAPVITAAALDTLLPLVDAGAEVFALTVIRGGGTDTGGTAPVALAVHLRPAAAAASPGTATSASSPRPVATATHPLPEA